MLSGFRDFDLDTSALYLQPVSEEILRKNLANNEEDTIIGKVRIIVKSLSSACKSFLKNIKSFILDENPVLRARSEILGFALNLSA